ncbi:MAG: polyphosphate kinase 1 [Planctomycetota bacterium]|nr:polyphosphate kinase 1 [Planctomycetota bacterium]
MQDSIATGGDTLIHLARLDAGNAPQFLNRELSWLEFNRRVLHEALDARTPLLERVRFLGIFNSNLDEFFMKRVGGLKRQIAAAVRLRTPDGLTLPEQMRQIRERITDQLSTQARAFRDDIRPALAKDGVHLLDWSALNEQERQFAERYFRENAFPVLTPLAVDPGHPFPFISNLSTSIGVLLTHPDREEELFARLKIPKVLPQWVQLEGCGPGSRWVGLLDIIRAHIDLLFPNMKVLGLMPFKILRNAEVERDESDADDLLEMVEEEIRQRRFAQVVQLQHGPAPIPSMLRFLMDELELTEHDVYEMPGELDYTDLTPIANLDLPHLRYEPWTPVPPQGFDEEDVDVFSIIRTGDQLVHHPYESFPASVSRFIRAAADDPKVLTIKLTVYRTGENSPLIHDMIRAANNGKQVACLVELKARFDEERNIFWAHAMEKAGIHVVYGIVGLKTHCKTALVVRQEPEGLRCYAHFGTGNYNVSTAKLYTDFGLFTCRPELTQDLVELFNYLTGRSLKRDYKKLLVAPLAMKTRFLEMIEREIEHKKAGRPSAIIAKMNSLEERDIIGALYRASQAGVPVDLIVRGFCCLKPGVPGLSDNIRVTSVIGRFLEHSRVFYFRNGCEQPVDGLFYIGSADWMYRNLLARVEAIAPVEHRAGRERLWDVLQIMLNDRRQSWELQSDGSYVQRKPEGDPQAPSTIGTHKALMDRARAK